MCDVHCPNCPPPPPRFKPLLPACARYHDATPDLGYMGGVDDAEIRLGRGETQIVCPVCCKYIWLAYFHHLATTFIEKVGRKRFARPGPDRPNPDYVPPASCTACAEGNQSNV